MSSHTAVLAPAAGQPMSLEKRPTPQPGPGEVLIEVKALALNIMDALQHKIGMLVQKWPIVFGSDVTGVVAAVGSQVTRFRTGDRVVAFASEYFKPDNNFGGAQEQVLALQWLVTPLPDNWTFQEGSVLPMQILTTWAGFLNAGISPTTNLDVDKDRKGLIVWGASSNIGCGAVQAARILGFRVYATCSLRHTDFVSKLGAARIFDYRSPTIVQDMVEAAHTDGITIDKAYIAAGGPEQLIKILQQLRRSDSKDTATIASAPVLPNNLPPHDGVELKFVVPPQDPKERESFLGWLFNDWLHTQLAQGTYMSAPPIKMLPGGLQAFSHGLDLLLQGNISAEKFVIDVA